MKKKFILLVLVAVIFLIPRSGWTQTSGELQPIIDEIKTLKEGQQNIEKELKDIKKLLQARPAQRKPAEEFKEAVVDVTDDPFKGDKTAEVTILEFSDYQ